MSVIGIYCIENNANGKRYFGQSVSYKKRISVHLSYLRRNIHYNEHLQNAFNKYGKDCFTFYIVQECSKDELNKIEKYYIEKFNTEIDGYNQTAGGDQNQLGINHPHYGKKLNNSSSKYLGVAFHKKQIFRPDLWRAYTYIDGKTKTIGCYHSEIEAAKKRDEFIKENNLDYPLNFC